MTTLKNILGVSALSLAIVAAPLASAFSDTAGHWVAEYLPAAIEEGAINSSKPNFRPNEDINRAELVKIVVNYDNGGENPTADDYEAAAGFTDVASSAWFYNHVNYAAEEGIIDGTKSTFRGAASMTRAEALKVITLALEVPSNSTKTIPYGDVSSSDWYYSYVTNAYNNCIIKDSSSFNPNDTITRAAAIKIFVKSLNPECEDSSIPTNTATATATATNTATNTATGTTASSNTVEVVLNTSVEATSVPKGGTNINLLALDVTAGSAEDVKVVGVTAYHTGHGDESDIENVKVFDGYTQRGNDKSFSGDDDVAAINLGSEAIIIPAGTTKTIFVKADFIAGATESVSHGVMIPDASGIQIYGVETGGAVAVSGSFPIAGPQREVANFNVGAITVAYRPVGDSTLEIGTEKAEIANLKISASNEEDVFLKAITIELQGVDDGDLSNLFVEVNEVVVSDVVASATSDDVTFDLTKIDSRGVLIEDSSSEYLYIKADLTSQIDSFDSNNSVTIDSVKSDIVAIGARHGFEVSKSISGTASLITFEGGDFELTLDGETSDIPADKDDVVLATLTIENFGAEAEIQKTFKLNIDVNSDADALTHIEDVVLVNTATGQIVFGPKTPLANGDVVFNDTLVVAATSKLILEVQADIKSSAQAGETFKVTLPISTGIVEGGPDLDDAAAVKLKPATGSISANKKTISLPEVVFTSKSLTGDSVVEGSENVLVWTGTVRSGDVEDIKITRIGFKNTANATTSDVNDYSLYATIGGEEVALETSVSSAATGDIFTFSSLKDGGLIVNKGEEIILSLRADIASEATAGVNINISLDKAEIQAKDEDGDFLAAQTGDIASGAIFTIVDNGAVTVTLDSSRSPDASIALAGEELALAVYKFKASDENIKVEDLLIKVTDPSGSSVESLALYYEDTNTAVLKTGGATATASVTSGEAYFEGLALTIAEGTDTYIEVRALIDGIDDNDSSQTAVSGAQVSVTLDLGDAKTDIKGAESGTSISGLVATTGEATFLVLNNKVLAVESALSSTTLASGTKEALKFTLDVKGDNEAYLEKVNVNVAGVTPGVVVNNLSLYEGGKLLAQIGVQSTPAVAAVAQVDTYTVAGDIVAGDVFTTTGEAGTYTAIASDTPALVAAGLAGTIANATASGDTVIFTAPTAGTPLAAIVATVTPAASTDATVTVANTDSSNEYTATIAATPKVGDVFTAKIDATNIYTYTATATDTADTVATALAAKITYASVTATAAAGIITVDHVNDGSTFLFDASVALASGRTIPTLVGANTTANVVAVAAGTSGAAIADGISALTIGNCGSLTCDSSTSAGNVVIKANATYVVKSDLTVTATDKSLSFEIAVNGANSSATDGIEWKDYGKNSDGVNPVTWIDLGNSSETNLSGTLSN